MYEDLSRAQAFGAHIQQLLHLTKQPPTALIVAVDIHGGFSKDGDIPWNYKSDLKHFKQITSGNICVMGRLTYESLPTPKKGNEILPGRKSFVITSSGDPLPNAIAVKSYNEIYKHFVDDDWDKTVFFIGGERVYKDVIPLVDTAYVTVVNKDAECDKHLPMDWILKTFDLVENTPDQKHSELRYLKFTRKPK